LRSWIIAAAARGDQHVALDCQQVVGVDLLDAVELHQLAALLHVLRERVRVDAGVGAHGAVRVRGAHQRAAELSCIKACGP